MVFKNRKCQDFYHNFENTCIYMPYFMSGLRHSSSSRVVGPLHGVNFLMNGAQRIRSELRENKLGIGWAPTLGMSTATPPRVFHFEHARYHRYEYSGLATAHLVRPVEMNWSLSGAATYMAHIHREGFTRLSGGGGSDGQFSLKLDFMFIRCVAVCLLA